jgi:hypothetical protein
LSCGLMSSTYAHYQEPSSLPSDYAILSALNNGSESDSESVSDTDTIIHPVVGRRLMHRKSLPHGYYYRPAHPTIGLYPRQELSGSSGQHSNRLGTPSETSPLLSNPPVPRIEEQVDTNELQGRKQSHISHVLGGIFNPCKVLPPGLWVWSILANIPRSQSFSERTFLNILSSSSLLCLLVIYPRLH